MKIGRIAAVIALGLAVTGCASGPTYSDMHASEPAVASAAARIYFYRKSEMAGAAVQPSVKVNGAVVGDAVPGGYFFVDEPAGTYEISTTTEVKEAIKATVKPGDIRYVRLDIAMGFMVGHVSPTLVWPEQGASEITDCHYTGKKSSN
jgi:hypothetical protein